MRLVKMDAPEQDIKEFICKAEYGIQEGEIIKIRLTGAKTRDEALKAFACYIQRNHPVEWTRIAGTQNIHIEEAA